MSIHTSSYHRAESADPADLNTSSRRQFLGQCTAGAATGLIGSIVGAPRATAIEPIQRQGEPAFRFSLAAYSYRDLLAGKQSKMTMEDFVVACAKLPLEGTELTSYYFPKEITPDYLRGLKQLCFRLGLDISGTAVGNEFCLPPGAKRDEQIAHVKRWIEYAEILSAPVIRIFSGSAAAGQDPAEARRLAVEAMEECCAYAGQHGVYLALENHGGLTATAEGMLALVRDVKSPWFAVNLDTGNFNSDDPYADLAKLAPYAVNVQVKVSMRPGGRGKQPADFGRLAQIMRDAGYRGYIVLEYEEPEDPLVACPRYIDELRKAFG
ncbi:MAG: sugar phosphate isomerase/epimerase family protein [Pirellulales bacterium]